MSIHEVFVVSGLEQDILHRFSNKIKNTVMHCYNTYKVTPTEL